MSNQPGVSETLALLDTLKSAVGDFVAREEKLNKEFRAQSAAALNALAGEKNAQAAAATAREMDASGTLEAEKQLLQFRFKQRQARINRVYASVSQRVSSDITKSDAEWRDRTQLGVQAAEIHRDQELVNSTARHESFQQNLATAGEELTRLESSARSAFRSYGKFKRMLASKRQWPEPDLSPDENVLLDQLKKIQGKTAGDLKQFRKLLLPIIFKFIPLWLVAVLMLGVVAAYPVMNHLGRDMVSLPEATIALAVLFGVASVYFFGGRSAAPLAKTIAGNLFVARRLFDACTEKSATHFHQEQERIRNEFEVSRQTYNHEWRQAVKDIDHWRGVQPTTISAKASRLLQKNDQWWQRELARLQTVHAETVSRLKEEDAVEVRQLSETHKTRTHKVESDQQLRWHDLENDWKVRINAFIESVHAMNVAADKLFPDWDDKLWQDWLPPKEFQNAAKFGQLDVDVEKFAGPLPKDERLRWPGTPILSVPMSLVSPQQGSILFETGKTGDNEAIGARSTI